VLNRIVIIERKRPATAGVIGGNPDERELPWSMNQLGEEGWDVVTLFDASQSGGQTRNVVVVFKRQKPQ
jgi:hypothetical protein